jgi:hypothetical protein
LVQSCFIYSSIAHAHFIHVVQIIYASLLSKPIMVYVFIHRCCLDDSGLIVLVLSSIIEIAIHILAFIHVLLLDELVEIVLLVSIHILMLDVVVVTHHLLLHLSLVFQRNYRHFLVRNVSVKNDVKCVIRLS